MKECNDNNCNKHGGLKTRGMSFKGTVIKNKMQKTAIVEWTRRFPLAKYERTEKRTSKVKAHIPDCMEVKEGDHVKIEECRQLSKTKNFIITENYGQVKGFAEKMEARAESKFKEKPKKKELEETEDESDKS